MPAKSKKKLEATKKSKDVGFSLLAPQAQRVFLVGNFNQWNLSSHPLSPSNKGVWRISIPLSPGRYEYRFLVDGNWQNAQEPVECVPNGFGSWNCVLEVR